MQVTIRTDVVHAGCGGQIEEKVYEIGGPGEGLMARRCLTCGDETQFFRHQVPVEPVLPTTREER